MCACPRILLMRMNSYHSSMFRRRSICTISMLISHYTARLWSVQLAHRWSLITEICRERLHHAKPFIFHSRVQTYSYVEEYLFISYQWCRLSVSSYVRWMTAATDTFISLLALSFFFFFFFLSFLYVYMELITNERTDRRKNSLHVYFYADADVLTIKGEKRKGQ